MRKSPLFVLVLALGLSGCTSEQLYAFGTDFRRSQCDETQTSGPERVRCLEKADKSYSEYEKDRAPPR